MALPLTLPPAAARPLEGRSAAPATTRPLPWVSFLLYGAVFVAGLGYDLVGDDGPHLARMTGFVTVLAVLMALDVVERRRYIERTPTRPAVVLLVIRVLLLLVLAAFDSAGLSRPLFVLIPFTAYFAFGRATSLVLAGTGLGVVLAGLALTAPGWYGDLEHVSDVLMVTIGLVLALSMAAVAADEQQARGRLEYTLRELEVSHARLTAYADRVAELSAATERNRLARDIHDSLGHHLSAIAIQIDKASAFRDRDESAANQALRDARSSARRALEDVRRSVHALREEAPTLSLADALADLVGQVEDEFLTVTLDVSGEQHGYDGAPVTALYRAAQEALTNARRHSGAARVDVTVRFTESTAQLVVKDDGRGLPPRPSGPDTDGPGGFGLVGMRERVNLVGGDVAVTSAPGAGTRVHVTVPSTLLSASRTAPSAPTR